MLSTIGDTMINKRGAESPTGRNTETLSMRETGRKRGGERSTENDFGYPFLTVNRWPRLVNSGEGERRIASLSRERERRAVSRIPPPALDADRFSFRNDRSEPRCIHLESIRPRRNNGERDQGWRRSKEQEGGGRRGWKKKGWLTMERRIIALNNRPSLETATRINATTLHDK